VPQEETWQDLGTHHAKKKLDIWDHMAMAVGPRPDTVTSDNLRSSRADADVRPFSPGSPVDMATDAPIEVTVPQTTGSHMTPTECYDVRFPAVSLSLFARSHPVLRARARVARAHLSSLPLAVV
jgi:hypothetical protein